MNVLITGATGFIGRELVNLLLANGHAVNYLARKRSPSLDSRAAFFCWNPGEEPPLECVGRLDSVIHLAGEPVVQRWTPEVKQRIRDSRVNGTHNLVSAIAKLRYKPASLVSASAIGYYGDRGDTILTEDAGPGAGFLSQVCVDWEREAERARTFGLRAVPVRISIVLGHAGGALPKMAAPFRYGLGAKLGDGAHWMPWIHVRDLARMLLFAAESSGVNCVLNGASPEPVRNVDFTHTLAKALHKPALLAVPRFVLHLIMGEMAQPMLDSMRVVPRAPLELGFKFEHPELSSALRLALAH